MDFVFYRSEERGKLLFIEYIPIEMFALADMRQMVIFGTNCLWVSGSMKAHGHLYRFRRGGEYP